MATVLIASTAGAGTSADITVVAGTPALIFLSTAANETIPQDAKALIEVKSNGGQYQCMPGGELTYVNPQKVIDAPGTYRVVKYSSGTAMTVEQG